MKTYLHRFGRELFRIGHGEARAAGEVGVDDDEVVLHLDDRVVGVALLHVAFAEPDAVGDLFDGVGLGAAVSVAKKAAVSRAAKVAQAARRGFMESPGGSGYCLSNGGGVRGWFYKTKPPTAGFWIGNRFEPGNAPLINVPMGNTKQTHRGERSPGIVTETPHALFTKRTVFAFYKTKPIARRFTSGERDYKTNPLAFRCQIRRRAGLESLDSAMIGVCFRVCIMPRRYRVACRMPTPISG
jgi:hypothetical protein